MSVLSCVISFCDKIVHLRAIWENINTTHSEWIRKKTSFPITRTLFESPEPNYFMPISKKKIMYLSVFLCEQLL